MFNYLLNIGNKTKMCQKNRRRRGHIHNVKIKKYNVSDSGDRFFNRGTPGRGFISPVRCRVARRGWNTGDNFSLKTGV